MKKINRFGFTLVEALIAAAIGSGLSLIILQTINQSKNNLQELAKVANQNTVEKIITTNFSSANICKDNLGGVTLAPGGTYIPLVTDGLFKLNPLATGGKSSFMKVGDMLGPSNSKTFKISAINFTRSTTNTKLVNLNIDYIYNFSTSTPTTKTFTLPITVYDDPTVANKITNCFFDNVQNIKDAVEQACQGNMTYFNSANGSYGTCDLGIKMTDQSASNVTITQTASTDSAYTISCPSNQLLTSVQTASGSMVLACKHFTTGTQCPADQYLEQLQSDGTWVCKSLPNIYSAAGTGFLVRINSSFVVKNFTCGAGQALQYVDATGGHCVPYVINLTCPANQYIAGFKWDSATSTVVPNCQPTLTNTACTAGSYAKQMDPAGNVTCANLMRPISGSTCSSGQVVRGWNSVGAAICDVPCP